MKSKTFKIACAGLVAAAAIGAGAYVAHRPDGATDHAPAATQSAAATPVVPVTAAKVLQHDVPIVLEGLGTVTPINTATIRTQVQGTLDSGNFVEGKQVKRGDVLAKIDPRVYEAQVDQAEAALARDAAGRCGRVRAEIDRIEARRDEMLRYHRLTETGEIPVRVTHNDTKISNILFDDAGEVLCVIDLDTVMNSPALNDFGDAVRSYANTGAEDDPHTGRVGLSPEMFAAYAEGYLSVRARELTQAEIDRLAFSARYITCEQVLRFLMDYIDGDRYYKTAYDEHNLVRARAQYALLCDMERRYDDMCATIDRIARRYRER